MTNGYFIKCISYERWRGMWYGGVTRNTIIAKEIIRVEDGVKAGEGEIYDFMNGH